MLVSEMKEAYPLSYFYLRQAGMDDVEILSRIKKSEKRNRRINRKAISTASPNEDDLDSHTDKTST